MLPKKIAQYLTGKHSEKDEIGKSDSSVYLFDDCVLKVEKLGYNATNELKMLQWLNGKLPVPKVLCCEQQDGYQYLLMSRLRGEMLCTPKFMNQPKELLSLLVSAVRQLWSIPALDCPQDGSIESKLRRAEENVKSGRVNWSDAEPETIEEFKTPEKLLTWLKENRPKSEQPVFSHGDLCLPNIFCDGMGKLSFLDLGRAGVADIWQDLADLWWSIHHNYNGRYASSDTCAHMNADELFTELGIPVDREKLRYFLLLDELY